MTTIATPQHCNPVYFSEQQVRLLQEQFNQAQPYRHIVMDNFLEESFAELLYQNFPATEKLNKHYNGLNENKSEGSNFEDFHPAFSEVKNLLMSKELAQWTAAVTGIPEVFVTDDNLGTGLHAGKNGSFLDIHIDFNIHIEKNVHRRLNMLIYMNKDWKPEYGGDLEMWDAKMTACIKKVAPLFNRAVIFETNEISYHGYSRINIPENITRKSIYTYFYTTLRDKAAKYHDTVFKPKPTDSVTKKVATTMKEKLKNTLKAQLRKLGITFK